jgi:hypothetical protein
MTHDPPPPRRRRVPGPACVAAACLAAVVAATANDARAAVARGPRPTGEQALDPARPEAPAFADRVTGAWNARDLDGWLALWRFATPAERADEEGLARDAFKADETKLTLLRQPSPTATATRFSIEAQAFVAAEPRGRVAYWRLRAEKSDGQWALVERQDAGQVDGLLHLSLGPAAYRVRDASLKLEDFELRMESGTLFQTSADVGPTGLVFVGRGRVVFSPRPPSEKEQLRQYSGDPKLDVAVGWAFARVHPADFQRVVDPARLEPESAAAAQARRAEAERLFRARSTRSFALDADLPRSPWWLLPGLGDAIVDFPQGRRVLTFAVSSGESEDLNLFDRDRQLQICVYPSAGRPIQYDDDSRRSVDVLEQDLTVRFEPDRLTLSAVHRMKLVQLQPAPTMRLRLDDDFRVSSITTEDGASLLFFRVREQNSVVVSLGSLGERGQPFTLVTRYAGRHDPVPVDQELLQTTVRERDEDTFVDRPPLVYSSRTAWYPRPPTEDFAPATMGLDVPEGWLGVSGGELVSLKTENRRVHAEFRSVEPGKFLTAVVGHLTDVGMRQEGGIAVRGYATVRSRSDATAALPVVQKIVAFYEQLFGPCPYRSLGLVIAEGETPGGHSPPGLVYLQQRPPVLRLRSLPDDPANFSDLPGFFVAHEVAHQWWGQGTAPSSYRERWLSEGWAQYAAALWVRESLGEGAFRSMMERMGRWAFEHDDAGPIHLGQRLGILEGDRRIFRAVVYDKGAWVLHMLRGLLGDDAFFAGARAFLEGHRFAKAGTEDFREALEKASGRDLRPYFERWIYDTGLPALTYAAHTQAAEGGFRTRVDVRADRVPGELPLRVALVGSSGRETKRVVLEAAGGSFTFETKERPRRVVLNDDRGLLARVERGKAQR